MCSINKEHTTTDTPKALIITPFFKPNIGGAETFAEDLAKALSKKYVVHICTINRNEQIVWEGMPFKKATTMILKLYLSSMKMRRKYKYDKIFALGLISSFVCMMQLVKFNAIILSLYDFTNKNKLFRAVLNSADKVFVEGKTGYKDLLNKGVKKSKIVAFDHWCDQSVFNYALRKNKRMRVLFIGRPIKIKGKHIIQECEKMTKGIKYEYVENVPFSDLPKHYKMADVVVVPSLYNESFSRVIVEAASCGCVLVTSNKGSLPEQVKDFGWTVEPTADNFARIIKGLDYSKVFLENKQLKTAIYAKSRFSEKNADCFLLC